MANAFTETTKLSVDMVADLQQIANTIRGLSIDAIEAAGCGHPGLPLGCAEIGAYLFRVGLNYNSSAPKWINRDAFILSAGMVRCCITAVCIWQVMKLV